MDLQGYPSRYTDSLPGAVMKWPHDQYCITFTVQCPLHELRKCCDSSGSVERLYWLMHCLKKILGTSSITDSDV